MFGHWGSHYPNGSLVFTRFKDGELGLVVALQHTGDCHHEFVRVQIRNQEDTPRGYDRIIALDPSDVYYGYYIGPIVTSLSSAQLLSLAAGVVVPKIEVSIRVEALLDPQWGHQKPYKVLRP